MALDLAVRRLGPQRVRAIGVKAHTSQELLAPVWSPPSVSQPNATADRAAGQAAGGLGETDAAF
eukprot:2204506-Alexandrium_andersonii.AAC.1